MKRDTQKDKWQTSPPHILMHIFIYVLLSTPLDICIYIYLNMYMHIHTCMCVYIYTCMYIYIYTCICMHICIYIRCTYSIYICDICIYKIYVYNIYIYIYIFIFYTYIYICVCISIVSFSTHLWTDPLTHLYPLVFQSLGAHGD